MLTRAGYALLGTGFALLTAGFAAGNLYFATAALLPLGVLFAGLLTEAPNGVSASVESAKANPRIGETVEVRVRYAVAHGAGVVELHVALPEIVEIVEGSNLHAVIKRGALPLEGEFAFHVRWTKRGHFSLGPVTAEAVHGALMRAPSSAEVSPAREVVVRPSTAGVRRIRGVTGHAKQLFPDNDLSKTGIRTTDFREIRAYQQGDPTKYINWKATMRTAGFADGTSMPLVNEYEREGKKSVWIFLDAAPYMQVGTTVRNSFEHALDATNGIASFYLERGYRVGFYVFNHDRSVFLYPDSGRGRTLEISRILTKLQPGPAAPLEGLFSAVDRAKHWLQREKPFVVIITRIGKADESTFQAIRKLRSMSGRRRVRIPVLIVSPVVHATIPANPDYARDLVDVLRRRDRPQVVRARRLGARVIEWDPTTARLESLLVRGAARR